MIARRVGVLSVLALLASGAGVAHAGMEPIYDEGDATQASDALQVPPIKPAYFGTTLGMDPATTTTYAAPASPEPVATVGLPSSAIYRTTPAYTAAPATTTIYSAPAPVRMAAPMTYTVEEQTYTPPVVRLSNEATELHKLVLRPDVTTAINYQGSERITTVLMGRAEDFFVDTPKNRQTISVRPKTAQSKSNLTVVTNRDIYHFDLTAVSLHGGASPVYGVVVEDRDAIARAEKNSLGDLTDLNFSYTFKGADDLRPLRLFDDGKHTFFQFPQHTAHPAVFAVGPDGKESIVNHHVKGNYLVVESLGRQFTLRRGSTTTCIYNKAYPKTKYGDQAPQPEGDA